MKLLDNDSIILSLEKAAEISLGIMGIIGIESTDDYYKGAKATYESVIEAFKKQEEFVDAVPVIRCVDCEKYVQSAHHCNRYRCFKDANGYCDKGERKEGKQGDK